ncbi:hypothetical protein QBC45DRAFT_139086 [Copromyces sp. CBS 386.78]|nr:hypothetical protein QBC45DRAFT_139086 [Copromyces sp. CBS 386.78]
MAARVRGGCHASALIIIAHPFLLGHPFLVYGHDEQLSCLLGTLEFPKLAGRRAGRAVGLTGPSVHAAPRKGQKDEECWRRGPKLNHGQHEVGLGDSGPCCAVQRVNPELADVPGSSLPHVQRRAIRVAFVSRQSPVSCSFCLRSASI